MNAEVKEGEVMPPMPGNALAMIARAEIDMQVATAHQYPRSLALFKKRALEMVSLDEETAASCIYSRPVGKKQDPATGKWVQAFAEGMSIRMAEIVGCCFGNLTVGAMLVEQTDRYVKARGVARDLESNFNSASETIESTVDSYGKPYSERMRLVVAKATLSKARRDATFQVVPRALCKAIEAEARKVALGDATTLSSRRAAVMQWIGKLGIDVRRVFASLGIEGEEDIGLELLVTLTGLKTAIKDGDVTVDEAFPPLADGASAPGAGAAALKDRLRGANAGHPAAATTAPAATPAPADAAQQQPAQPQAEPTAAAPAPAAEEAKPAAPAKPAAVEKPPKGAKAAAAAAAASSVAVPAAGATLEQWAEALKATAPKQRADFMKEARKAAPREFLDSLEAMFDDMAFGS